MTIVMILTTTTTMTIMTALKITPTKTMSIMMLMPTMTTMTKTTTMMMMMMMMMMITWQGQYTPLRPSYQSIPPPCICHCNVYHTLIYIVLRISCKQYSLKMSNQIFSFRNNRFTHLILHLVKESHREAIGTVPKIMPD